MLFRGACETWSVIRALRPSDVSACEALLDQLPEWFGIEKANANYVAALHRLPAFVAVHDGEVRGFLALEQHGSGSAEILVMGVDRALHRRGLGRDLIAAAEHWCADHQVRWLHVKTRGPSTYDEPYERTRRFYRAMGFEMLYESATEWGPENAALVLVKHLPCSQPSEGT
jgi:GNAT superfamily N-acetyltransferase